MKLGTDDITITFGPITVKRVGPLAGPRPKKRRQLKGPVFYLSRKGKLTVKGAKVQGGKVTVTVRR